MVTGRFVASGEGLSGLSFDEPLEQAANSAQAITIVGTRRLRIFVTTTRKLHLKLVVYRLEQAKYRELDGMCNLPSPVRQQRRPVYRL